MSTTAPPTRWCGRVAAGFKNVQFEWALLHLGWIFLKFEALFAFGLHLMGFQVRPWREKRGGSGVLSQQGEIAAQGETSPSHPKATNRVFPQR